VKSETIRKRQSIAAVLGRIVMQLSAKYLGPLWSIDLATVATAPAMQAPTMVIGIDVYTSVENGTTEFYIGFAASLDAGCSEYFSIAARVDGPSDMSVKIQTFLKTAMDHFDQRNSSLLPEHFIVYRASVKQDRWAEIRDTEIAAIQNILQEMQGTIFSDYCPKMTFIAMSKRLRIRFFQPPHLNNECRNPEPGTIIDSPMITDKAFVNFYLVSQAVGKGTSLPSHYVVLFDSARTPATALQSLTYRLCFLYFNSHCSIRLPAPAQYAKKIAHLVGSALHIAPDPQLQCCFFYL
jgi:hypothetical protein